MSNYTFRYIPPARYIPAALWRYYSRRSHSGASHQYQIMYATIAFSVVYMYIAKYETMLYGLDKQLGVMYKLTKGVNLTDLVSSFARQAEARTNKRPVHQSSRNAPLRQIYWFKHSHGITIIPDIQEIACIFPWHFCASLTIWHITGVLQLFHM